MTEGAVGQVSRRRVLVGTAWATPAVLIAASSPPAAASTITPTSDMIVVSSQNGGTAWGTGPNSFGLEITYYLAYGDWIADGVDTLATTLHVWAMVVDPETGVETGEKLGERSQAFAITQSQDAEYELIVNDIPAGSYNLYYRIVASEVEGDQHTWVPNQPSAKSANVQVIPAA